MPKNSTAPGLGDHGAGETIHGGGTAAVCAPNDTMPSPASSTPKACLVTLLAALWHYWPALGKALGHIVRCCWRGFREA